MSNLREETLIWEEYESAADYCAKRGETLPQHISTDCIALINDDPDAFQERIKDYAYANARKKKGE